MSDPCGNYLVDLCHNKCYHSLMLPEDLRRLRHALALSRAALGRFLCLAEMTVIRWETGSDTGPRGLHLAVLVAVEKAAARYGTDVVARIVRDGMVDQGQALRRLFEMAYQEPARATLQRQSVNRRRPS